MDDWVIFLIVLGCILAVGVFFIWLLSKPLEKQRRKSSLKKERQISNGSQNQLKKRLKKLKGFKSAKRGNRGIISDKPDYQLLRSDLINLEKKLRLKKLK